MKTRLDIGLQDRSYPIFIADEGITQSALTPFIKGNQVMIVTNTTIKPLYLDRLLAQLSDYQVSTVVVEDGEQYKTQHTIDQIYTRLLNEQHNRTTTLIALGGGVVGDMTGYAAACYQRGVNFIQIPTTLLSQVDSSVGGKTGINHPLGKNMVGAFKQPQAVFIDVTMLKTLPAREFSAGYAEVVKYALLGDASFLDWLEDNQQAIIDLDTNALITMISHCCNMKARIVEQDETEQGKRALLNLGHTFGHAIEVQMGYGEWLHGEAVATGMLMAADLSQRLGHISTQDVSRIKTVLESANLPVKTPATMAPDQFLTHMAKDKKVLDGSIRLILLKSIGDAFITDQFDHNLLNDTLRAF